MDSFDVGREDQALPLKAAIFGCPILPRVGPSAPETQLGYGLPPNKRGHRASLLAVAVADGAGCEGCLLRVA